MNQYYYMIFHQKMESLNLCATENSVTEHQDIFLLQKLAKNVLVDSSIK